MNTTFTTEPYSERINSVSPSCIREILSATTDRSVISFAGGLPNPALFPVGPIREITHRLLSHCGSEMLQYSSSEGYEPLRRYVAEKLLPERGITATPEEIIITSGSQQALDLIGKVFINPGDGILMESPSYLSAIQAFQLYQPVFASIKTDLDGLQIDDLRGKLNSGQYKMLYTVPTFQNPTGLCYSAERRTAISEMLHDSDIIFVEDDPYRDLRFEGEHLPSITHNEHRRSIMLSSFSKIISPGFRLGWMYAPSEIMERLKLAKQASDLCTGMFMQRVMYELLTTMDLKQHIAILCEQYRNQRDQMSYWMRKYFPRKVRHRLPWGGMFIWVEMPEYISATELLKSCMLSGVVFAPGASFYADRKIDHTMRINFSYSNGEQIRRGIEILGRELHARMKTE